MEEVGPMLVSTRNLKYAIRSKYDIYLMKICIKYVYIVYLSCISILPIYLSERFCKKILRLRDIANSSRHLLVQIQ